MNVLYRPDQGSSLSKYISYKLSALTKISSKVKKPTRIFRVDHAGVCVYYRQIKTVFDVNYLTKQHLVSRYDTEDVMF